MNSGDDLSFQHPTPSRDLSQTAAWSPGNVQMVIERFKDRSSVAAQYDMGPLLFDSGQGRDRREGGVCQAPTQSPSVIIRTRSKA